MGRLTTGIGLDAGSQEAAGPLGLGADGKECKATLSVFVTNCW